MNRSFLIQKPVLRAAFLSMISLLIVLPLGGCSGGGKTGTPTQTPTAAATGLGAYRIVVKWPAANRATVLEQASSIVFTIAPSTGPVQTQTLNQSDTAESVEFTNVAVGEATVSGTAFTGENGSGTAVGKGTSVVVIVAGQTSEKDLTFVALGSNPQTETGGLILYPVDSVDGPDAVEPPVVTPPETVIPPVVTPPVAATPSPSPNQTLLRVSFDPARSRYPRGTQITIKAEQYSPDNIKAVGQSLKFVEYWTVEATGEIKSRTLASRVTDDTGTARLDYTVPNDPQKDNVKIHVVCDASAEWQPHESYRDLPIGLP